MVAFFYNSILYNNTFLSIQIHCLKKNPKIKDDEIYHWQEM